MFSLKLIFVLFIQNDNILEYYVLEISYYNIITKKICYYANIL